MTATPFKVHITLKTPMVEPRQPIYLDGLLSGLRVAQDESVHWDLTQHDLPLERYVTDSAWCFKASAFLIQRLHTAMPWMLTGRVNLVKAAEDRASGALKLRASLPNTAGGPFKASKFNIDLVWAELTAWGIGDIERVRQLLEGCEQIGGRRSGGHGQLQAVTVEPVSLNECHWNIRNLPHDADLAGFEAEYAMSVGNLVAPYWKRTESLVVWAPI